MNIRKIIITLALVLSLFSVSAYAKTMQFTMGSYDAKVDDGVITTYTMEVAPYTVEGRTMVPVRILTEAFGADVKYIEEENKVIVTLDKKVINFIIGQDTATVDGESVKLDVPTVETNGRTLIPLRFVSENLGFDVEYLASTEQILITNDPAVIEIGGKKISFADYKAMYKINAASYGEMSTPEEMAEYTKAVLSQYAIYDSEAAKWEVSLDPSLYANIKNDASQFAYVDGVLDASLVSLFEKDYRAMYLTQFLSLLYTPDEKEAEEYYMNNYYAAKHILVSDKATANKVLSKVNRGGDFDELMAEYTEDTGSAEHPNGYLFTEGEMVEEFENAVKALKIGKISNLVKSDYGYHIIMRLPLPEYGEVQAEYAASAYADARVAEHYNSVADSAEIKDDTYTIEQLVELCK